MGDGRRACRHPGSLAASQKAGKGEFVLAINLPPVAPETKAQTGWRPSRRSAAWAARPMASTASARAVERGVTGPGDGSSQTASRVKCARISWARPAKRRSQPLTVVGGTPSTPATLR